MSEAAVAMNPHDERPTDPVVSARTSERVAGMSDAERVELARVFATRKGPARYVPASRSGEKPNDERARAVVRLTAELRSTERHIARLERAATPSRFAGGGTAPATGRYARLLSRADRLERQLRALR